MHRSSLHLSRSLSLLLSLALFPFPLSWSASLLLLLCLCMSLSLSLYFFTLSPSCYMPPSSSLALSPSVSAYLFLFLYSLTLSRLWLLVSLYCVFGCSLIFSNSSLCLLYSYFTPTMFPYCPASFQSACILIGLLSRCPAHAFLPRLYPSPSLLLYICTAIYISLFISPYEILKKNVQTTSFVFSDDFIAHLCLLSFGRRFRFYFMIFFEYLLEKKDDSLYRSPFLNSVSPLPRDARKL